LVDVDVAWDRIGIKLFDVVVGNLGGWVVIMRWLSNTEQLEVDHVCVCKCRCKCKQTDGLGTRS
jgi:hypothetical protein